MANTNYEDRRFYVYALSVEGEENPFYVGKGQGRRAQQHFTPSSLVMGTHKDHTILKAWSDGKEVFIEYHELDLTHEEACTKEIEYIAHYGRRNNGTGCLVNLTDGGGGFAGFVWSEERKAEASKQRKGHTGYMLGKKHSDETKRLIAEARRGYTMSEESKQKLSESQRGHSRKHSEETKRKMSASRKGKTLGPPSEEARLRMSEAAKRRCANPEWRAKASIASSAAMKKIWAERKLAQGEHT